MTEPILDPDYWSERLNKARELHHSIFRYSTEKWREIEEVHKGVLDNYIGYTDSVLDIGCAYGRLLELMPMDWDGRYLGVDICPDFIDLARDNHPDKTFVIGSILDPELCSDLPDKYDWAVLISFRPMVIRNLGGSVWEEIEYRIRKVADRLLYLEYDLEDWSSE